MILLKEILLLAAYSVDMFLLAYIMRDRFELCYRKKYYFFAYGGAYLLSLIKQIISFIHLNITLTTILTISVQGVLIYIIIKYYKGKWYRKLIAYGIYSMCALISEGLVIWGIYLGLSTPIDEISRFGTVNILCTSLTKVIFSLLIYIIFVKNSKETNNIMKGKEILPILLSIIILHIPAIAMFDRPGLFKSGRVMTSYFLVVQIILIAIVFYIFYLIQKNKLEINIVEKKLHSAQEVIRLNASLRELRHDMSFHVNILLDLAYKGDMKDMIYYIENSFECVKILDSTFHLKDQAVSSALNYIAQKTKEMHIEFKHIILIENLVLPSHEMCSLLLNILSNAMDATEKVKQKRRTICLEIAPSEGGYIVNCMNTYKNKPEFNKGMIVSSKEDEKSHGKGIRIIKKIVEKHGGAMDIMLHDETKVFEMNCFIPSIVGEIQNER